MSARIVVQEKIERVHVIITRLFEMKSVPLNLPFRCSEHNLQPSAFQRSDAATPDTHSQEKHPTLPQKCVLGEK